MDRSPAAQQRLCMRSRLQRSVCNCSMDALSHACSWIPVAVGLDHVMHIDRSRAPAGGRNPNQARSLAGWPHPLRSAHARNPGWADHQRPGRQRAHRSESEYGVPIEEKPGLATMTIRSDRSSQVVVRRGDAAS